MGRRFPDNHPYRVVQMNQSAAVLTTSNVTFQEYDRYFTSGDIPQFSSLALVFDQYRILEVECWLVPRNPGSASGAAVNRGLLYSVVDYDDAAALGAAASFLQYENCVVTPNTMGHYRKFRPHIAVAAYSGTFAAYANVSSNTWIDCTSNAVQYYGVKFGASPCDAAADETTFDFLERVLIEFRNVR
jgi:hypothetical protein